MKIVVFMFTMLVHPNDPPQCHDCVIISGIWLDFQHFSLHYSGIIQVKISARVDRPTKNYDCALPLTQTASHGFEVSAMKLCRSAERQQESI